MKLLIYIPAFNEEANIRQVLDNHPRALEDIDCIQYLVIDDGSTDQTAALARQYGADVVSHWRNRGVGAAFHSALQFALENHADILVGIDADGQFACKEIEMLITPILSGQANVVVGNRFPAGIPESMARIKYWGNCQVARLVSAVCGQEFSDVSCGFRAYDREALLRLNVFGQFTYTHETIISLVYQGMHVVEMPVSVKYFPDRTSRVARSIPRYAWQTIKIIFRVMLDYRPLHVFGSLGGIFIAAGMLCEMALFAHYALTRTFTPYKNLGFIGLGLVIFGMLALLIALLSDMLNRLKLNQEKILYELKKSRYGK
jgi:glycosyltransferase involved in cell wall biosynthesis